MVFSSASFLIFFLPCLLVLYFLVPRRCRYLRNLVLLAFSLAFYACGGPKFLLLMLLSIAINYAGGLLAGPAHRPRTRRLGMTLAVVLGLALLGWFKYAGFFGEMLHALLPVVPVPQVTLPIGISFYTFQILSYVIDVYREDTKAQKNILSLGTYVALFPQLIAGPIVRYKDVDAQLSKREQSLSLFSSGLRTFLCGLGKKVLLANAAGSFFDRFRAIPEEHTTVLSAWLGILLFAFQIYFDFSGYSDMAIGLGKMFGFRFLENFNYPYISRSITEFWRRWHISLSTWFREYLYYPLGGSRVDAKWKLYRNLLAVWFCTGFWHGANWNFILWGLLFFVFLVLEKSFLLKFLDRLPRFVGHLYTMLVVLFGWVLFNFSDLGEGGAWISHMFGVGTAGFANSTSLSLLIQSASLFVFLILGSTPLPKKIFYKLSQKNAFWRTAFSLLSVALLGLCSANIVGSDFNPFLYFNF